MHRPNALTWTVATIALTLTTAAACAHGDRSSPSPADAVEHSQNVPTPTSGEARVYVDQKILDACGLVLPQAFFPVDSARLGADDEEELRVLADCLATGALADASVMIVGHTDPQGSEQSNEALSEDRARSVMTYLEESGVDGDRMDVYPMGEEVASEDRDDWPANRRVDVRLLGREG